MSNFRVLLADPDEQLLQVYRNHLQEAGFEVETARDALVCIEQMKSFDPDLLVLEPIIPLGQGEGILTQMREQADVPMVPVILLTQGDDLLESFQLPRFPVLGRHQKPMKPEDLTAQVQHMAQVTAGR